MEHILHGSSAPDYRIKEKKNKKNNMNYIVLTSMPRILQSFSEFAFHYFDWCLALTNFQKNHIQAFFILEKEKNRTIQEYLPYPQILKSPFLKKALNQKKPTEYQTLPAHGRYSGFTCEWC